MSATTELSDGPGATEALGARLAARLGPGDVVLVMGEVGAGKSTLIRGACRALGVTEPVTSPTFTIGRRYQGRMPVSHLDLYRLADLADEDPALLDDYLTPDAVAFVEWPDAPAGVELRPRATVTLVHRGGDRRAVTVEPALSAPGAADDTLPAPEAAPGTEASEPSGG